jgi:predicted AAA+ superfamily ATPase
MREVLTGLAERRLVDVAEARFAEEPVLVLNGPRTVGKSTLLGQLAGRLGRSVIDCDDPATRSAVRADPGRFVESAEPADMFWRGRRGTPLSRRRHRR